MAKGKKKKSGGGSEPKGKKVTLAMARNCVKLTVDGKRRLDLSNQGMASVPKSLLGLCDVEELDLSRNLLKKLPDFIDKFVNLRFLDVHSNYLEYIPQSIGRLQNLLTLNLCNNRLTSGALPSELGLLAKLHKLNLGLNRLDSVPRSLAGLKELRVVGLFDNRLTAYPDCLRPLKKLEKVNLESNPFPPEVPAGDPEGGVRRAEGLYLVDGEACLCGGCLDKCRSRRRKVEQRVEVKPRRNIAGLLTPNSVAQVDQQTWR
ncbi:Leucine-rich repeat-containing protein 18 [Merluccius polli]|uniref:Leucine-rich repeat-containing protein 18 n=1 Tax=Merluccius polli TaxID=89951 RepID=A0AA47P9N4_MERPO|nr:Leucine-rich repeat-containing protein 18 [Merluccius polli]